MIDGGGGNDVLFGDVGEGTAPGADASPLTLDINNFVSDTYFGNNADAGDSAVYRNVAQLEDGTQVWGRLVLVSKSDPNMTVDLSGGNGFEILMNGNGTGDTADFRFEFFDPATGDPVALNSVGDVQRPGPQQRDRPRSRDVAGQQLFGLWHGVRHVAEPVSTGPGTVTAAGW